MDGKATVPKTFKNEGKVLPVDGKRGVARLRSESVRAACRWAELVSREPENSYPNLRTRRLRKTHRVAGPKFFKAVGPLLRL